MLHRPPFGRSRPVQNRCRLSGHKAGVPEKQLLDPWGKNGSPMGSCTDTLCEEPGLFKTDVGHQVIWQGGRKKSFPIDRAKNGSQMGCCIAPLLEEAGIFKTDVGHQVIRQGVRKIGFRPDGAKATPWGSLVGRYLAENPPQNDPRNLPK